MKAMLAILVFLNGQAVNFTNTQPVKENNRVLVPLRGVFEAMDADVHYDALTRNVEITRGKRVIEMAVERSHAWVDGREVALDAPVRVRNGRALIPLRFVAENFGADVRWDSGENTVFISTERSGSKPQQPPAPAIRAGEIEVSATTDKSTYRAGEAVTINIVAQNQDEREREITYGSGQSFDVTITPVGRSTPRWDWSHGRAFTLALRYKTLAPGERMTFSTTWEQKDNDGKTMPPGKYSVVARLTANGGIAARPVTITLAP